MWSEYGARLARSLTGMLVLNRAARPPRESHEVRNPSPVHGGDRHLRVRQHLHRWEHEAHAARGRLLQVPPVLHGAAAHSRYRRPRGALPQALQHRRKRRERLITITTTASESLQRPRREPVWLAPLCSPVDLSLI